jgi:alkylation response protein AidB-like acyl-CoA dehydrogenase
MEGEMDTRDTPEQGELRRAARQIGRDLGPGTVGDLDDQTRANRLAGAARDAGWLELRDDDGDGGPLASAVEAAIVAGALGETVADVAFSGPVLAGDLARRARAPAIHAAVVAFAPDLSGVAIVADVATRTSLYAVDTARETDTAYVLVPERSAFRLGEVRVAETGRGADLTRAVREIPPGTVVRPVSSQMRLLTTDDLIAWSALGLALTSADLVGVMRGLLGITVTYAGARRQYGVPIGSFQAVQHLLAEAHCLMEGSHSVALHASWCVDSDPAGANEAGRVAKAYSARAARTVCETAVQVHGGIGNTWDCIAHVYLRRALLSSQWFGDDAVQLAELRRTRLGRADGISRLAG